MRVIRISVHHFNFNLPSAPPCRTLRLVGFDPIRCHYFTFLNRLPHVQPREKSVIARLRPCFESAVSPASPLL
jgi:hypothetical protein